MSDDLARWFNFLKDQPCQICKGVEGCDHSVTERRDALLAAAATPPSPETEG